MGKKRRMYIEYGMFFGRITSWKRYYKNDVTDKNKRENDYGFLLGWGHDICFFPSFTTRLALNYEYTLNSFVHYNHSFSICVWFSYQTKKKELEQSD